MNKLLEVQNLSVDFNVRDTIFRAVDEISLNLDKNETMALRQISYSHVHSSATS